MATKKVSALTALTSPDGSEELLVNDGGTSKKVTIDNLLYDESIDSDHYVDGSIDNAHLADDAVDSDELAAGAVDIAHLSATGTAGATNFLRGDNSWVVPTDTNTMGSGFTVSATTDTTPTTITQGDDLMFTAGTGITTETTADGTVTIASTVTDTNTMGSGFTVSATTDSNATTITQGDDLMFTAGTGITCETTADGTVTISNTVSGASTATSSATGLIKIEDDTDQSVAAESVSTTANRTYGLQLNSSDQGVVNVPWTDTNTTYSAGDFKLDDLDAPDDNTDLDFTTSAHGLVPKGTNTGNFLKDDGTWAAVAGIPTGVIAMWYGAISNIPTGWVICDGTNSTPNLTDRFVIHADADSGGTNDVGDTGGSHTATPLGSVGTSGAHTLTTAEMPSHTHSYTYPSHYRTDVENTGYTNVSCLDNTAPNGTAATGGGGSHTHPGGTFTGSSTTVTPKYYALAYIMKT